MPFNGLAYYKKENPFNLFFTSLSLQKYFCSWQAYFYYNCGYISCVHMATVTLNRLIGIVLPKNYNHIANYTKFWVAVSWLLSPIILLPFFFVPPDDTQIVSGAINWGGYIYNKSQLLCVFNVGGNSNFIGTIFYQYMIFSRVLFQLVPAPIMIVSYSLIYHKMNVIGKEISNFSQKDQVATNGPPKRKAVCKTVLRAVESQVDKSETKSGQDTSCWDHQEEEVPRKGTGATNKPKLKHTPSTCSSYISQYTNIKEPTEPIQEVSYIDNLNFSAQLEGLSQENLPNLPEDQDDSEYHKKETTRLSYAYKEGKLRRSRSSSELDRVALTERMASRPRKTRRTMTFAEEEMMNEISNCSSQKDICYNGPENRGSLYAGTNYRHKLNRLSSNFSVALDRTSKKFVRLSTVSKNLLSSFNSTKANLQEKRRKQLNHVHDRNKKILKLATVVCATFSVLFLPSTVIWIYSSVTGARFSTEVHQLCSMVTWFNSCVNPIIYFSMNSQFQSEFRGLVRELRGL